ncbi:ACT domain-containing protein [Halofilum ochraceum]|uniref:ACT domain-containing protein n=1 Tax=Halofilum ochraceum TaxID=1611323 RepID=UPI00082CFEB9|nr:ACT domain-containing protein [Halofilum ochraceum]
MAKPALHVLDQPFSIHRLAPDAEIPPAVLTCTFHWIARTDEETSIVCPSSVTVAGARTESGWSCIKVIGPIDFAVTGLLAELSRILAGAGISLFALSTFDTDYLLVPSSRLAEAVTVLGRAGYAI